MVVLSLEIGQGSSGIELVYVCVCEGGEGRLGYSSIFYILSNFHTRTSESMYYIQHLASCILSSMASIPYAIFDMVSCIYYIQYCISYILYICYVLDSEFYNLYMLHVLTSILLLPSLCTVFNILLPVFYLL